MPVEMCNCKQAFLSGKRGISWHIATVYRKHNGRVFVRYFAHILDESTPQDSWAVAAILTDVLSRVKREVPDITGAYIRSDNAGCYHGSRIVATVPHISAVSGVTIRRWDYSEPQSGKGPCDRAAACIKRKVWNKVAENNPARTPAEFADAAASYGGTRAVSIVLGNIPIPTQDPPPFTLTDISKFFNFEYGTSYVKAWKAYNIGVGHIVPMSKLEGKFLDSSFVKIKAYHEGTLEVGDLENTSRYWKQLSEIPTEQGDTSDTDEVESPEARNDECDLGCSLEATKIFSCPVEGCIKKFQYEGNLVRHIIIGKHKFALERETAIDFVQKNYQKTLSQSNLNSIRKAQQEMVESFPARGPILNRGWALKASRLVTRFNQKQRQYLVYKFEEGRKSGTSFFWKIQLLTLYAYHTKIYLISGRKFDAAKLSRDMRHELNTDGKRKFTKDEFLTTQQITSFWSRYASSTRANAAAAREEARGSNFPDVPLEDSRADPNIPTDEDIIHSAFEGEQIC